MGATASCSTPDCDGVVISALDGMGSTGTVGAGEAPLNPISVLGTCPKCGQEQLLPGRTIAPSPPCPASALRRKTSVVLTKPSECAGPVGKKVDVDLVGVTEIADRLAVTIEAVRSWRRRYPDFPHRRRTWPAGACGCGRTSRVGQG